MKDTIDALVNDVKIYSTGLINALENQHQTEAQEYIQNMKKCLKTVEEYLIMKKDIEK